MAGVASYAPGQRFHPARPREDAGLECGYDLVALGRRHGAHAPPGATASVGAEYAAGDILRAFGS